MALSRDMSAQQAFEVVQTLLDAPEDRFPLTFNSDLPRIRELFHAATRNQWDPQIDVPWDQLDPDAYTEEQRYAARLYWSRRAWSEYGAISESPALQVRFGVEHRPSDMQLFFTIRSQEEARHAEVCHTMAERLGGYIEKPVQQLFEGSVATHGVRRAALSADIPLEGIIAALVCTAEEIAFDVFRHLEEITRDPVAKQVVRFIMRDEFPALRLRLVFPRGDLRNAHAGAKEDDRGFGRHHGREGRAQRLSQFVARARQPGIAGGSRGRPHHL